MIDGLKPYPEYKDSGVPWLGEVPGHWEVRQLGRFGLLTKGNGGNKEDEVTEGVPCVRYGDLYTQHRFFIERSRSCVSPERANAYTPIRYGDVLFAASGETIEEIGKSSVNLINSPAVCGGDVLRFTPAIPVNPRFLGYACDCPSSVAQKSLMGRGFTVMHIYGSQLKSLSLALPPLPEQAAIVRFLDHADRRIRRYIRAKQKLIKLLEEQKQAIIHNAVTRGLDPNVRLKPSGVEWLGDVPEHWEVRRNGRLFSQRNETGFADLPILEVSLRTGVRVRDFETGDRKQVMTDHAKYKRTIVGDIAYNMMRMWQGAVGIAPADGLISPAYVVAKPIAGTESRYFVNLFRTAAYMAEVDKFSRGIVKDRNRLYWEDFKRMPSCYPPPAEQLEIANAIDARSGEIDTSIHRVRQEIELLREYLTRLIADVVTGKLDVRGVDLAGYGDALAGPGEDLADEGDEGDEELELVVQAEE
jgi:type I restriction enzyme S subunit